MVRQNVSSVWLMSDSLTVRMPCRDVCVIYAAIAANVNNSDILFAWAQSLSVESQRCDVKRARLLLCVRVRS